MKLKNYIAVLVLGLFSCGAFAADWTFGGNIAQGKLDDGDLPQEYDTSVGGEIWAGINLDNNVWLNFGYKNSAAIEQKGSTATDSVEVTVQQLQLFMEARRSFNKVFGIYFAAGFSRFLTELEQVTGGVKGDPDDYSGFTYGADLGMKFNVNDTFGFRVGYEMIDDIVGEDDASVGLTGFYVGIELEI